MYISVMKYQLFVHDHVLNDKLIDSRIENHRFYLYDYKKNQNCGSEQKKGPFRENGVKTIELHWTL